MKITTKNVTFFKDLATGKIYKSVAEASEDTGDKISRIYYNLNRDTWTRSGHKYVTVIETVEVEVEDHE